MAKQISQDINHWVASTTEEHNQATQNINQHGDDQDRTSIDCQNVGFAFAQDNGHKAQF